MPAGLKFKSRLITTLSLITVLLSACSRDNPLNVPEKYIEEPEQFCINDGPYSDFTLLKSIALTNTTEALPEDYPQGFNNALLNRVATFLISQTQITPIVVTDTGINDQKETVLIVNEKQINPFLGFYLTQSEIDLINESIPEVASIFVSVTYPENGAQVSNVIDNQLPSFTADLEYGKNTINTEVIASIEVPRTTIDCQNPLTTTQLNDEAFKDRYRVIKVVQNFEVEFERQSHSDFKQSELTTIVSNSENDQLGKIVSLDDNFLIIGIPNEDTLEGGITPSETFITKEAAESSLDLVATQNEGALNSGAVYIYRKSGINAWTFHSFIKSSNNESDDLFGSAVALNGNTLIVSAPGEDSIASGIHNSLTAETENLKLNNLASSSGAVYIFKFDEDTNTWSEKYYIKPEQNVITDGDYNKGFGHQLAMHNNKLLVSAPLEDSDNGDSSNSNKPNSGAVYVYDITTDSLSYKSVIKSVYPSINDEFGSQIAINDNFIVVSSPFEDHSNRRITNSFQELTSDELAEFDNNGREDSGAIYIFEHSLLSGVGELSTHIKASNSDKNDYFGSSISISNNKLFVGSIGEDGSGKGLNRDMSLNDLRDSGAVYMFSYDSEYKSWVETTYIKANDTQADASFGKYLAATKDNLFVSAPLFDNLSDLNAGKAYFYDLTENGIYQDLLFQDDKGTSSEMRYGSKIATYGQSLIIGASGFINTEPDVDESFVGKLFTFE